MVSAPDGSRARGHDVEPAGALVEKLQHRLQVRRRGVLVADRELRELDAGQRDADGRELEDLAGRSRRAARGARRGPADAGARPSRPGCSRPRSRPPCAARTARASARSGSSARTTRCCRRRTASSGCAVLWTSRIRAPRGVHADGAVRRQQELFDLDDRRRAVDAVGPLAGLQRRGLDLQPDDSPERGHTRVIFFRMSPSHAYFRRLRPRAAFFCSALP